MAIYAYADETIFTINKDTNEQALGCGIFVTQNKIEPLTINEALKELSKDNEFDLDRDQRTINRNFFSFIRG
jgi:hypothetical protein